MSGVGCYQTSVAVGVSMSLTQECAPSNNNSDWRYAVEFFLKRLRRVPFRKAAAFVIDIMRHRQALLALLRTPRGSNLGALVAAYPEIFFMASGPYLAENWNGTERIVQLIDHCNTVAGSSVDLSPGSRLELCHLRFIDPRYRLIVHQPREYIWEGLLDLSLCYEERIIFSVRFSLSSAGGKRIAYIGAVQGRNQKYEPTITDIYKDFSLKAERMRPRDFMIEAFQLLCSSLGIDEILAVSDENKPRRCYERSYNEDWRERGGIYNGNGFFRLPTNPHRRSEEDMPSKKRAMYRRRYRMLAEVQSALGDTLQRRSFQPDKILLFQPKADAAIRQRTGTLSAVA